MSYPRIDMYRLQELVRLHRLGTRVRERCKLLKMSASSEKKYRDIIAAAGLLDGEPDALPELMLLKAVVTEVLSPPAPPQRPSSVQRWIPKIKASFERGAGPKAIYDTLKREEPEFCGSIGAVKRVVKRLKKERGVQAQDVAIIVETLPGEVAQVDFGYFGRIPDDQGRPRKAWVFVMVLGYSRMLWAKVVFDQSAPTWQTLHREAFEFFGGVPEVMVPDNLKAAVVRASFGLVDRHELALNRSYIELARHYQFKIDPTPAYAPEKKGKVESAVKYVKGNFLKPQADFVDLDDANQKLARWVRETANQRLHGTLHERPVDRFEAEAEALSPLPERPFEEVIWHQAKVHRDAHVAYKRRLYSVPWRLIGQQAWLRITARDWRVYVEDERVATHDPRDEGPRSSINEHLPPHRRELANRSLPDWLERANALSESAGLFARELSESDDVLSKLNEIQDLVLLLERYPEDRVESACKRARLYGLTSAIEVKRILLAGLDLESPTPTSSPISTPLLAPRFARTADELLQHIKVGSDGPN